MTSQLRNAEVPGNARVGIDSYPASGRTSTGWAIVSATSFTRSALSGLPPSWRM